MEHFKNKKKGFDLYKLVIISLLTFVLCILSIREYSHYSIVKEFTGKIWAMNPETGGVFSLESILFTPEQRKKEYNSHTRKYLKYFFQFDKNTFLDNMDAAKRLMKKESFDREIGKYREERTLETIEARDIILTIEPPIITIDMSVRPFKGTFKINQILRTTENQRKRIIEGEFNIENTQARTNDNPHAAILYNYRITRREIIK